FSPGILSGKIVTSLILAGLALAVSNRRELIRSLPQKNFLLYGWGATIFFFLMPTLVEGIVFLVPQVSFIFSPLRTFTFKYGLHIFDFFISLTLCLILGNENLKIIKPASTKKVLPGIFLFL